MAAVPEVAGAVAAAATATTAAGCWQSFSSPDTFASLCLPPCQLQFPKPTLSFCIGPAHTQTMWNQELNNADVLIRQGHLTIAVASDGFSFELLRSDA